MKCLGGDLTRHFVNHCGDGAVAEGWHLWMEVEIVMDCVFRAILPLYMPRTGEHRLWVWDNLAPRRSFT